jgi:hypothetical protein
LVPEEISWPVSDLSEKIEVKRLKDGALFSIPAKINSNFAWLNNVLGDSSLKPRQKVF